MKLVTRNNLEYWADTTFSKATLPYLISRLVRATTPASTKANLPSGSASYIGGWDGVVNCETKTAYVPQGISLWEFGTSSDCKGKADDDYDKRKANPIGFTPSDSVFIFVTPRLWTKKDEWIAAKKAENHWKDVIVYDSIDLEQWLDNALSVSRWLASQDGVGTYPFDGIMTADEFWEEWSIGPKGLVLSPECLVAGREYEKDLLLSALQGDPTIKGIKASTKIEAIAFIIASAKLFPTEEFDRFFSKALIVDTEGNFRGIVRNNITSTLNLIPRFDEAQPLYLAVSKGNYVLVPLGADDDFNQETITLPTIDRDGQINALVKSGLSQEDAEKFSRESGRNITILKKLLRFPHYKAKWIEKENIREIIPALILGRWNETFVGDIELIEKLSEQKYSDYSVILNKWKNLEESPIIQIGETWRLTSPLDLWTALSSQLSSKDFQNIQECYALAFKNGNPIVEPVGQKGFAAHFNKKNKYSTWSREGLTQSLILVGQLNRVKIPNLENPQNWVDNIIFNLLNNISGEIWVSVNQELPLISEASPESFLKAVNNSLAKEQPEIMDMFNEDDGFLHTTSHHAGLLWALESLAWLPEYLKGASLALLKLSRLDPGGSLSNRPSNSILEIFKPWHFQTLASYDERMKILQEVTKRENESGWNLLISMLPNHHAIAMSTHKMRWRMFDKNTNLIYTYKEVWDTHSAVIEMLINLFDNDEEKFSQVISKVTTLNPNDRKKVLDWAATVYTNVEQKKFIAWKTIREILNHQRSFPDAEGALHESELSQFGSLYNKLQPTDIIHKYIWLFDDEFPCLAEGFTEDDNNDERQTRVNDARKTAVSFFLKELGLNQTLELRKQTKCFWILGGTLADVITDQKEVLKVCECLNDEKNLIGFAQSFVYRKSIIEKFDWIKSLFKNLKEKGLNNKALSNILIPLNQNQELWDFVNSLDKNIEYEYWKNIIPRFYQISREEKVFGIQKLLEYKRFFSATDVASNFADTIPSKLLSEILKKAVTEEASEEIRVRGDKIELVFEELDKRNDIDKSTLIHLEWLYLPLLDSYVTRKSPKNLEEELANSPTFFIDVLKCFYIPKDKAMLEKEREGISNETIQNRAKQAYHLLHSWKKIPGMKEDNSIDEKTLRTWVESTRTLAQTVSRLDVADAEIGRILAQYPENISLWIQERGKIFQLIEEINTDSLKRNYSSAMFNKRGFSSRAAFEGGNIERQRAAYFEMLENEIQNKYPNVAEIFKDLKEGYLVRARREDESAERDKLEY